MTITPEQLEGRIQSGIPNSSVKAKDLTGGGDHWQVTVISDVFEGKSLVQRHQMIYQAVGDWMKQQVHALSISAETPKK